MAVADGRPAGDEASLSATVTNSDPTANAQVCFFFFLQKIQKEHYYSPSPMKCSVYDSHGLSF
jgi:hypothetical protein